jgi:beta-lactam-binding protein with PASTA domain
VGETSRVPLVTMPNLIGLSEREARDRLARLGLTVIRTVQREDDKPPGTVIDTAPVENTPMRPDSPVILVVTKRPAPPSLTSPNPSFSVVPAAHRVPDVKGRALDQAQLVLHEAGFGTRVVRRDDPGAGELHCTVVDQEPAAGTTVGDGTRQVTVVVRVSTNSLPCPS